MPVEVIGALLGDARMLYIRQLDPERPYGGNVTKRNGAQPFGPVVPWDQVFPVFPPDTLNRLCLVIKHAEAAFDGINPGEKKLMRREEARIPTEKEMADPHFLYGKVHSLDPDC